MLRKLRPRSVYDVVALLALFVALGGGAIAATGGFTGSDGKIHGCVAKAGQLSVVKPDKSCGKGKTLLSWNQRGPQGRQGPGAKQFEWNQIPTDGVTYPLLAPVNGLQVKGRCDSSKVYILLDTSAGKTLRLSGFAMNDNTIFGDNPVGSTVPPAEWFATAYGGFQGVAQSSEFFRWTDVSIWSGHYSDHCRFWGTMTPAS
jgi:hypothetical protein